MSDDRAISLATHAMGCRFELLLSGAPAGQLRAAGEQVIEEIESAHGLLTRFERGSVVSRINGGELQRLDAETFGVFTLAERIREQSGGAFDIARSTGTKLMLDSASRTAGVSLGGLIDLGGIAKGYAIDLAIRTLRDAEIPSAFVHAGSSSGAAIGHRPDGSAWHVSIGKTNPVRIDVTDRAFAVSGDGEQGAHIIDPRSGDPAPRGIFGACVGDSACECDAWATALCVLGERPLGMPESVHSILPEADGWRIEPIDRPLLEDCRPCAHSTDDRS